MPGGHLLQLPVHPRGLPVVNLHPIHPQIAVPGVGVAGDDTRQGDEASAIQGASISGWANPARSGREAGMVGVEGAMGGGAGQGSTRVAGASNRWMTSLHGPELTGLGFAWRRSSAVPSSLMASRKPVGGLAFMSEPSSAATSSRLAAPRPHAMRRWEPKVLMASGNGEIWPLTVGRSKRRAWPPPGFFISLIRQFR